MALPVYEIQDELQLAIDDIKSCWVDLARGGQLPDVTLARDLCLEETAELQKAIMNLSVAYAEAKAEAGAEADRDDVYSILETPNVKNAFIEIIDALADMLVVYSQLHMITHPDVSLKTSIHQGALMSSCMLSASEIVNHTLDLLDVNQTDVSVDPMTLFIFNLSGYLRVEPEIEKFGLMTFFDAVKEVSRSNWSKFPLVEYIQNPVQECLDIELRSKGRYTGVGYEIKETAAGDVYVFRADSGKVVKSSTFSEPNFARK